MNDATQTQSATSGDLIRIRNKNLIFAALAEAGIHRVTVEYDGCGDSGQIESIEAWNAANEKIPLPSLRKVQLASENTDSLVNEIGLEAAVEQLAWDYLYDNQAAGRTMTAPSAPSSSASPTARSRFSTTSATPMSIPPPMNFDGGSHGASAPSQPFLGQKMGARSSTICRCTAGSTSRRRSPVISGTAHCATTPRAYSCWLYGQASQSECSPRRRWSSQ